MLFCLQLKNMLGNILISDKLSVHLAAHSSKFINTVKCPYLIADNLMYYHIMPDSFRTKNIESKESLNSILDFCFLIKKVFNLKSSTPNYTLPNPNKF